MAVIQLGGGGRKSPHRRPGEHEIVVSAYAVLDALRRVKRLIFDPSRWHAEALALDAGGRHVLYSDPRAVRWSATGAIFKVTYETTGGHPDRSWELSRAVHAALDPDEGTPAETNEGHISWVNKHGGHAAVIAKINAAIRRLSAAIETEDRLWGRLGSSRSASTCTRRVRAAGRRGPATPAPPTTTSPA